MNMIKLYGKPIRVNKAYQDKKSLDVGANLFVGNLDPVRNLMHSNVFSCLVNCYMPMTQFFNFEPGSDFLCRMWMRNFCMILSVHLESLLQIPRSNFFSLAPV
ncbi:unnamed protein product [Camellia sinensis]